MPTSARMQLIAWFLQVQTPSRGSECGSEDYLYAGDTPFRRDRTTELIKCTPWGTRLYLHPTFIKKMKTFLEVEGKMGPIPGSQFRPPLPDTNPNIRKDNVTEKRKRATPKTFRPATPKPTAACPPLPEAPPKPKNDTPYHQYQHKRAQAKCQEIYFRTEIGCSHQITWKIRLKMNPKP